MLIEALIRAKIEGTTLLDIGGGIGAIQHALLDLGISHATVVEGFAVYPRDTWWNRVGLAFLNLLRRLRRDPFRVFVHPSEDVEASVRANGLAPLSHGRTVVWRVDVYVRREAMGTA